MNVVINKRFEKDLLKVKDQALRNKVLEVIEHIEAAKAISSIQNLKKLKGWKTYYRIRVGDYRLGLEITGSNAEFLRFGHRQQIYSEFP